MSLESKFQKELRDRLKAIFPGSYVLKNDTRFLQGVPDLLVLWKDRWAMLEVKRSLNEPYRPNQEYYLSIFDGMSFASMICPENEEEVLGDLQRAFGA